MTLTIALITVIGLGAWCLLAYTALSIETIASKQEKLMAQVSEVQAALTALAANVAVLIPLVRDAGLRIDPAALNPILSGLVDLNTQVVAVLPPSPPPV